MYNETATSDEPHLVRRKRTSEDGNCGADDRHQRDHHHEYVLGVHLGNMPEAPEDQEPKPHEVYQGQEQTHHLS